MILFKTEKIEVCVVRTDLSDDRQSMFLDIVQYGTEFHVNLMGVPGEVLITFLNTDTQTVDLCYNDSPGRLSPNLCVGHRVAVPVFLNAPNLQRKYKFGDFKFTIELWIDL